MTAQSIDKEVVKNDLCTETPQWILSCYSPIKQAAVNLFGGPSREQSFEEIRLRQYEMLAQGRQQEAIQHEQALVDNAQQQIRTALNDLDGAVRYIIAGEDRHPNRNDICKNANSHPALPFTALPQPGVLGKPAPGPISSAFEQPPSLGQPLNKTQFSNPFSAAAATTTASRSTQPAHTAQGLSQPSLTGIPANPFARATAVQQPNSGHTTTSSLASNTVHNPNPFVGNVGHGVVSSINNPFARSLVAQAGSPSPSIPTSGPPNVTIAATRSTQATQGSRTLMTFLRPQAAPTLMSTGEEIPRKFHNGRLISWNRNPVSYIDDEPCFKRVDGLWERIWFPNGAPPAPKEYKDLDGKYNDAVEQQYKYARENGAFEGDIMPELPPKWEWSGWNF